jgi:hypothetical protein
MTPVVLGLGRVDELSVDPDPRVHRLPRLERFAVDAARQALAGRRPSQSLGLVFATGYGGLTATEAYLQSIATRGMGFGSPTAFHQSVHHSAAGQLSLLFELRGPVLTVSEREVSGEAALRLGLGLLDRVEQVLVVAADERTSGLEAAYRAFGSAFHAGEGAAAVLLGRGSGSLTLEHCALFSHPASARRFASAAQFGPPLRDSLEAQAGNVLVSIAAPSRDVEEQERRIVGTQVPILEDVPGAAAVGFHPSAGLVRFVVAARRLGTMPGDSGCVLHGLALGGAQSLTVLRHVA